jgi:ubiquinone/menaquinone biosynthesis C-methylase UbiE
MTANNAWQKRKEQVPSDFNQVASTYDLLTGMNPGYKKHLLWSAERLGLGAEPRILDLCCGTGLSTSALVKAYPNAEIDGVDASQEMLSAARRKRWNANVQFALGNAMDLSECALSGPYDGILMAYGIRNVPEMNQGLKTVFDNLKPGGRVCFHEYSVADSRRSRLVWNGVTAGIIIPAGLVTARGSDIYRYLRRSVLEFDGVKAFERRLRDQGFINVRTEPMDGWQKGIVHTFIAERPSA